MSHHTLRTFYYKKSMIMKKENSSFELDAKRVKRRNSSPGMHDLIVDVTR